jgi:hypothetical protein
MVGSAVDVDVGTGKTELRNTSGATGGDGIGVGSGVGSGVGASVGAGVGGTVAGVGAHTSGYWRHLSTHQPLSDSQLEREPWQSFLQQLHHCCELGAPKFAAHVVHTPLGTGVVVVVRIVVVVVVVVVDVGLVVGGAVEQRPVLRQSNEMAPRVVAACWEKMAGSAADVE